MDKMMNEWYKKSIGKYAIETNEGLLFPGGMDSRVLLNGVPKVKIPRTYETEQAAETAADCLDNAHPHLSPFCPVILC